MSEFDDPALRDALEHLAGYAPDDDVAFTEVRHRSRTVRRRRAGVLTLACAGVLGVAVYGAGPQRTARVTLIDAAAVVETTVASETTTTVASETTTTPATTMAVATPPASPTTVGGLLIEPVSGQQPELGTIPTTVAVTDAAAGAGSSNTRAPRPAPPSGTSPASGQTAPPPPTAVGRQTDSYSSEGGSVSVASDGSTVTLVRAVAGDGFIAEIDKSSGSSVRVNFVGRKTTFRVRAKLDDGRIVFEVQKDDHQETTSTDPTDLGDSESGVGNGSSDSDGDGSNGYGDAGDHGVGGDG